MTPSPNPVLAVTDVLARVLPPPLRRVMDRPLAAGARTEAGVAALVSRAVLVLTLATAVLLPVTHLVDLLLLDGRIEAVNADADSSAWGWASVATEAGAALLLGLLAATRVAWRSLAAAAVAVAFLSLDDFIQVHERVSELGSHLPVAHASRIVWPLLFMPLMAFVFVLVWRVAADATEPARAFLRGGLLALAVAIGLEIASPLLFAAGEDHGTAFYELEVAVEETLEQVGWLWVAGGLVLVLLAALARTGRAPAPADD